MTGRDIYVAIVAAGDAGSGIWLTAEETHALRYDDAIEQSANLALNEDGQDMVRRFGWGHLRYITRNRRATKERAMHGLDTPSPAPQGQGEDRDG